MALTANDPRYQPGFEDVDTSVQAAVPFYGVYDFTNRHGHMAARRHPRCSSSRMVMKAFLDDEPEKFAEASPIDRVRRRRAAVPRRSTATATRSRRSPTPGSSSSGCAPCRSEPVLYAELAGAQHAFDVFPSIRTVHVIEGVERFLRAVRTGSMPQDASVAEQHVEERTDTDTDVQAAVESMAD